MTQWQQLLEMALGLFKQLYFPVCFQMTNLEAKVMYFHLVKRRGNVKIRVQRLSIRTTCLNKRGFSRWVRQVRMHVNHLSEDWEQSGVALCQCFKNHLAFSHLSKSRVERSTLQRKSTQSDRRSFDIFSTQDTKWQVHKWGLLIFTLSG